MWRYSMPQEQRGSEPPFLGQHMIIKLSVLNLKLKILSVVRDLVDPTEDAKTLSSSGLHERGDTNTFLLQSTKIDGDK